MKVKILCATGIGCSILISFFLLTACRTTDTAVFQTAEKTTITDESTPKSEITSTEKKIEEKKVFTEKNDKELTVASKPSSIDQFRDKINNITLSVVSAPSRTTKKYAFKDPFVVRVTEKDGTPVSDFPVTISYPETRTNDIILFATESQKTDSNGIISYMPPVPEYSCNNKITFYPTPASTDPDIIKIASDASVSAPWIVKTDYTWKGGLISIVDYDLHDHPITTNSISSSNLLMALIQNGFSSIGNADFTTQIKTGNQDAVYKAAKDLVGHNAKYLIYGTVKYAGDVQQSDSGYTCTLTANIICLNMDDGTVLYKTTKTVSATEKAEWKVLGSARKKLAEELCKAIIYGL